ncbi:MAG: IS3 family transposase [Desulfosporosinus sp.]|nr:IS3 family transposase [Desulfosporosinus sp.]
MSKKLFSSGEIEILSMNPNVKRVSEKSIIYSDEFKQFFINEYYSGVSPTRIFERAGFSKEMMGYRIDRAAERWKKAYDKYGMVGLLGRNKSTGRPSSGDPTEHEIIKKQQAKIKLLEAEVELLKKVDFKERRRSETNQTLKISEIYEMISNVIIKYRLKQVLSFLCKSAGVSRSGYYRYISTKTKRLEREKSDEQLRDIILMAYSFRGYKKGSRSIKMTLEGKYGIIFNRKRIQRIMRKYGIVCPIRKSNPYRRMQKANQMHHKVKNILNRKFNQTVPGKVLLTDITYLKYGKGETAYLSTVKDTCTHEIIAYQLSKHMDITLVIDTFQKVKSLKNVTVTKETIVHSDQGCHYTSNEYQTLLKSLNVVQSMSRKGNCWDNAPQESFYGHMKDELNLNNCRTYELLEKAIEDYMDYYNHDRYQWGLKKMTPAQYRDHLLSA